MDDTREFVFSGFNYFSHIEKSKGWSSNYIGDLDLPKDHLSPKFERAWPLGVIFQAIRDAGSVVEKLCEHNERYYPNFQNLKLEIRQLLPIAFSLLAVKPQ